MYVVIRGGGDLAIDKGILRATQAPADLRIILWIW